jgi:hypothetical protein
VFVDANGGARGTLRIVNSVLPSFVAATNITIPSHLPPETGLSRTYYSSTFNTNENPNITTQTFFADFTGTTQLQGSTLADFSYYYDIGSAETYTAYTGTLGSTITGYHPYLRIKIINDGTPPADAYSVLNGDVTKILTR